MDEPISTGVEQVSEKHRLMLALDSLVIADLAAVFSPRNNALDKGYAEQVADILDKALRGLAQTRPDTGWKVLPTEPTDEMADAMIERIEKAQSGKGAPFKWPDVEHMFDIYVAAVNAAPVPPSTATPSPTPDSPRRLSTMRTTPPELSGQGSETSETGVFSSTARGAPVSWQSRFKGRDWEQVFDPTPDHLQRLRNAGRQVRPLYDHPAQSDAQHDAQLEGLAIGLEQRGEKSAAHLIRLAIKRLAPSDAMTAAPATDAVREALEQIMQRANESGTGEMALMDTIHAMHRLAETALSSAHPRHERGAP